MPNQPMGSAYNGYTTVKKPPRPGKMNPTAGLAAGDLPPRKRLELLYGGNEDAQSSRNNNTDPQFQFGNIVGT